MDIARVKDIMTDKVVSVTADTPVVQVAALIVENHFNGVPVVDAAQKLIGIVTEFDLINKEKLMQLPTLSPAEIQAIGATTAGDVMNKEPITLHFDDAFDIAVATFNKHHRVNPIPVIDGENKVVGIVSRYDLVKLLKMYGHT